MQISDLTRPVSALESSAGLDLEAEGLFDIVEEAAKALSIGAPSEANADLREMVDRLKDEDLEHGRS